MVKSKQIYVEIDSKTEYKKKLLELKVLLEKAKEEGRDTTEIEKRLDKLNKDYRQKRTIEILKQKKDIMKKRKKI